MKTERSSVTRARPWRARLPAVSTGRLHGRLAERAQRCGHGPDVGIAHVRLVIALLGAARLDAADLELEGEPQLEIPRLVLQDLVRDDAEDPSLDPAEL